MEEWEDAWKWTQANSGLNPAFAAEQLGGLGNDVSEPQFSDLCDGMIM